MIGVDLWDKRVWIAVYTEWVVLPHDIVNRVEIIRYLRKLIKQRDAKKIIVGLPYDLYGVDTKQLDKTRVFIEKLASIFPEQEIIGQDERFTTFEAEATQEKSWKKMKNSYKDDISAALILEWYIHQFKAH